MIDLITAEDNADHSTGKKKWARQCELHNQLEIEELERKLIESMYK